MLPTELFKTVVDNAPLFAIDLVVVNESDEILVGKRLNAPAKDWWFVPGGRVFKNERLSVAFQRLSRGELGAQYSLEQAHLLGLFEHFYDNSVFDSTTSTHYINATHLLRVKTDELNLPTGEQHLNYRWVPLSDVESDTTIHRFSKVFMSQLVDVIAMNKG